MGAGAGVVGVVPPLPGVGVGVGVVVPPPPPVAPTLAVTVAVVVVLSVEVAKPFESVAESGGSMTPAVVENATGANASALPLMSKTVAEMVELPPAAGISVGLADTITRPTAAVPTAILIALAAATVTPPDDAVIVAVPFVAPASKMARTRPLMSVSPSGGLTWPSVVVKMMCVPEWGGVPAGSTTCAINCAVPFTERAVADDVSVIVDPFGASRGTRSQLTEATIATAATGSTTASLKRAIFKILGILSPMPQSGQVKSDAGYAMAALLVGMSVAAAMMAVVMPVWKQMARREKEEELIFRGLQYSRALRLFSMKYANASPPNLDVLVEQRFLRKKYKDPITNDDFQPVLAGQAVPGTANTPQNPGGRGQAPGSSLTGAPGRSQGPGTQPAPSPFAPTNSLGPSNPVGPSNQGMPGQPGTSGRGVSPIGTPGAGATGGIIGVVSKSKDQSIRLYNGRSHYNEWAFINTPQVQAPGAVGPGGRGGRGGPGNNPANPNNPTNPANPFGTNPFNRGGPGGGTTPMGPGGRPGGPQPNSPGSPVRPIQPPTKPR